MAALAGIPGHSTGTAQPLAAIRATPMANSTQSANNSTAADTSSAAISANDFLTLLVTEMKNQDPTANTDPNEYINQLVNVNSLEQLIDINQTLSTATGSSNSANPAGATGSAPGAVRAAAQNASAVPHQMQPATQPNAAATAAPSVVQAFVNGLVQGNLSTPATDPAALRLSQALGGNPRHSIAGVPATH
jgi:flagellar basal-body rod modification protein FlgD